MPLVGTIGGGSPLTWSISTEWFFYLAYVVLAFVVLRLRRPATILIVGLAFGAAWVAAASTLYDHTPAMDAWAAARYGAFAATTNDFQDSFARWLQYMSPYLRIGEFILGCLVAQLFMRLRDRPISGLESRIGGALLLLAAASVPAVTYAMYSPDLSPNLLRRLDLNFGLAPSAALLIFCAVRYQSPVSRALRTRACLALGEASYSIYLIHYIVLMIVVRSAGGAVPATAAVTPARVVEPGQRSSAINLPRVAAGLCLLRSTGPPPAARALGRRRRPPATRAGRSGGGKPRPDRDPRAGRPGTDPALAPIRRRRGLGTCSRSLRRQSAGQRGVASGLRRGCRAGSAPVKAGARARRAIGDAAAGAQTSGLRTLRIPSLVEKVPSTVACTLSGSKSKTISQPSSMKTHLELARLMPIVPCVGKNRDGCDAPCA